MLINAGAVTHLADRVRLHGGLAEVCIVHPADHAFRLDKVEAIDGIRLVPRSYAYPGSLWVTSAAELAKTDDARAYVFRTHKESL